MDAPGRRALGRCVAWAVIGVAAIAGAAYGMKTLEQHVLRGTDGPAAPVVRVALANPPDWMPASQVRWLAARLTEQAIQFNAPGLTGAVCAAADRLPQVRTVHRVIKRLSADGRVGRVEVSADFRQAIARVQTDRVQPIYVDADGVVLPPESVPRWLVCSDGADGKPARRVYYADFRDLPADHQASAKKLHYIAIQGVGEPPPKVGQRWPGGDLAAGLRLVRLLMTRKYANQITLVDVQNHGARLTRYEPEIRMYAQVGRGPATEIRFGRFPREGGADFLIPPERKMSYLDTYVAQHNGQLAGLSRHIDLRYDELRYSRK